MKRILVIGATSAIAAACARLWAGQGDRLFLVGRDGDRLAQTASDLSVRGAAVAGTLILDAADASAHVQAVDAAVAALGGLDVALIAHGNLPDQAACQADAALAVREFNLNAVSVISLLTLLAQRLEAQGAGRLAVISSVAGDRGRPSNYLYGAAKGAVSTFCEGLAARLAKKGVSVTVIKPGFVATPMTAGLPLPGPLVAQPDQVAGRIVRAIDRGAGVVYAPAFWWPIMLIIRHIPRVVFNKLNL